jgi:DNA/RNA endonuclease YhcR with UshA esterase domain
MTIATAKKPWADPQPGDVLTTADGRAYTVTGRERIFRGQERVQYRYVNAVGHRRRGNAVLESTWLGIIRRELAKGGSYVHRQS